MVIIKSQTQRYNNKIKLHHDEDKKNYRPAMQNGSCRCMGYSYSFTRNQSMVRPKRPRLSSEPRTLSTSPSTVIEQL